MTPETFAALHANGMNTRPWTAEEFTSLLSSPLVFAVGDDRAGALGRVVSDEAELLTLVTDPGHRRKGLGRSRLVEFEAEARARGAIVAFLEVAGNNEAAIRLYESNGWSVTGSRFAYYETLDGKLVDAVLMSKNL